MGASTKYYQENPEARKKKAATDKKINKRPEQVKKRVEANAARRKAKAAGKNVTGKDASYDRLLSIGDISQEGGDFTFTDVVYVIDDVEYIVESQEIPVQYADSGDYRIDIVVANNEGELVLIQGTPDPNTPVTPVVPENTILVTTINIFGENVQPIVPPITDIKLKSHEAQKTINNVGTADNLVWGKENTFRWTSSGATNLILGGLSATGLNSQYLYDGRLCTIINSGGGTLIIKHFGAGDIKFSLRSNDLALGFMDNAVFKYSILTNRLELLSTTVRTVPVFPIITRISKGYHFEGSVRAANISPLDEIGDFFSATDEDGKFYPCLRWRDADASLLSSYEGTYNYYHRPFSTEPDFA